jgi:hypothetical protein
LATVTVISTLLNVAKGDEKKMQVIAVAMGDEKEMKVITDA